MSNALIFTFVFAFIQITVGFVTMAWWKAVIGEAPESSVTCSIVMMTIASLISAVWFLWMKWAQVSRNWIRTRPWAVLCWSAVASLGLLIPSMWLQELMPAELPNISEDLFEGLIANQWGYLVIGLMAPFVEELVFRGAVLRSLLLWSDNKWMCISISAALFAIIHMNPAQVPHAFLIGWLLGWMYYRTGSIIPGVVYHWVNNSVVYAVGHISYVLDPTNTGEETLLEMFGGSQIRMALAIVFSLMILLPAIYQLNLRLKK